MNGESCKCKLSWPIVFILHDSNGCIRKSKIIFQDWYLWWLNLSSVPFVLQVVFFSGKSRWSGLRRGGFLVVEGGDCYWSAAARPCGALLPPLLPPRRLSPDICPDLRSCPHVRHSVECCSMELWPGRIWRHINHLYTIQKEKQCAALYEYIAWLVQR